MTDELATFHYSEVPDVTRPSLYLAGPTRVTEGEEIWHERALRLLRDSPFSGSVFLPTPRDGVWRGEEADQQSDWQDAMLAIATCILVWLPYPGPMTFYEIGRWQSSRRMVVGAPREADWSHDILRRATQAHISVSRSLNSTVLAALSKIGY